MFDLKAESRWCLTGTPIQNRLEDIGALFAFIRVRPFDSMAQFKRFIAIPFDESEDHRTIASQHLSLLIDAVCLRRTKELLRLPEQQERPRHIEFSPEERKQYENAKAVMIRAMKEQAGEEYRKNKFGMFQAQLQLRLLCNHGTFQHAFSWKNQRSSLEEKEDALSSFGYHGEIRCSLCRQAMPILGSNGLRQANNCAHVLCSECRDPSTDDGGNGNTPEGQCPLCRSSFGPGSPNGGQILPSLAKADGDKYFNSIGYSSKMRSLTSDVLDGCWENKRYVH